MMRVEIHDNLRGAISLQASRVVIYDQYDNPISVVVHVEGGQYIAVTAAHKSFQKILKSLGINKALIVDHLDTKRLKAL